MWWHRRVFNLDPTFVRLGFSAFVLFAGTGLLAYIIAALIIPKSPLDFDD